MVTVAIIFVYQRYAISREFLTEGVLYSERVPTYFNSVILLVTSNLLGDLQQWTNEKSKDRSTSRFSLYEARSGIESLLKLF